MFTKYFLTYLTFLARKQIYLKFCTLKIEMVIIKQLVNEHWTYTALGLLQRRCHENLKKNSQP